jgi:lantibiotic transport system ATP-binding protein
LIGGRTEQIARALSIVRLTDAADRTAGTYSQGMRQRLGLALALLNEPELLVLDEPTNGLDPSGIQEMRELIGRLRSDFGITVLLSSHLLAEVEQVATHIGIIQNGRLIMQGALADLHAHTDEHLVLGVDQPETAKALLRRAGWTVRSNGGQRLTVAANGHCDASLINSQLVSSGVNIYHLSLSQPTLEDIFVNLTKTEGEHV